MEYKIGDKVKIVKINEKRPFYKHIIMENLNKIFKVIEIDNNTTMPIKIEMEDDFYMWLYEKEFELIKKDNNKTLKGYIKRNKRNK